MGTPRIAARGDADLFSAPQGAQSEVHERMGMRAVEREVAGLYFDEMMELALEVAASQ
jgi:purine-nucleoside phosphorylase